MPKLRSLAPAQAALVGAAAIIITLKLQISDLATASAAALAIFAGIAGTILAQRSLASHGHRKFAFALPFLAIQLLFLAALVIALVVSK